MINVSEDGDGENIYDKLNEIGNVRVSEEREEKLIGLNKPGGGRYKKSNVVVPGSEHTSESDQSTGKGVNDPKAKPIKIPS